MTALLRWHEGRAAIRAARCVAMPKFTVLHHDGGARRGTLLAPSGKELQTPALLVSTTHGHAVHNDNSAIGRLRSPGSGCLGVAVSGIEISCSKTPASAIGRAGGAASLFNLPDVMLFATVRGAQNFEFDSQPTKNVSLHVTAFKGATYVTPAQYMDVVLAMRPDFYIAIADETHGHLSKRRAENAAKRSRAWLEECLQRSEAHNAALAGGERPVVPLGSVVGCAVTQQGHRVAQGVAAHDAQLGGYYIAGHGVGESPEERRKTLATVLQDLPAARMRYVSLVGGVEDILQNVSQGIDVLESRYALEATAAGQALVFTWPHTPPRPGDASASDDGRKLSLRASVYKEDAEPILQGCTCYACQHHSRAFIHHLLDARELLGDMLLDYHNTHHLQQFMHALRCSIERGEFQAFCERFGVEHAGAGDTNGAAA